jgi:hypothetical protein
VLIELVLVLLNAVPVRMACQLHEYVVGGWWLVVGGWWLIKIVIRTSLKDNFPFNDLEHFLVAAKRGHQDTKAPGIKI